MSRGTPKLEYHGPIQSSPPLPQGAYEHYVLTALDEERGYGRV